MKEIELFNILQHNVYPELLKAATQYSVFDCVEPVSNLYIELKCRATHYNRLLIEKSKFDRLMSIAVDRKKTPVYINSTPEGIYIWDLTDVDIVWEDRKGLPVSTEFDNKNKITKTVGYLNINDAKVLNIKGEKIMDYSKDISTMIENIVVEGKSGKQFAEGHRAAAATYREYDMEGAALIAEQQAEKLEQHNEWLKKEWRRLKQELDSLPY